MTTNATSLRLTMTTIAALYVFPIFVLAQTPDGETPANEGVCDSLHGGTPGLYGLCVAYCEAQDLDAETGNPPSANILEIYNKRRKATDPTMPCLQDPCPCWTEDDLDIALPTLEACQDRNNDADPVFNGVSIFGPSGTALNNAKLTSNTQTVFDACFFVVQQPGLPNSFVRREMFISEAEGAICEASARQHAASLGVACETP